MIEAKVLDSSGNVKTCQLADDPSDQQIIAALGAGRDIVTVGAVGDWEAVRIAGAKAPTLVIGAPPYLHADVKSRQSCNLSSDQVIALVAFIDGWP